MASDEAIRIADKEGSAERALVFFEKAARLGPLACRARPAPPRPATPPCCPLGGSHVRARARARACVVWCGVVCVCVFSRARARTRALGFTELGCSPM